MEDSIKEETFLYQCAIHIYHSSDTMNSLWFKEVYRKVASRTFSGFLMVTNRLVGLPKSILSLPRDSTNIPFTFKVLIWINKFGT